MLHLFQFLVCTEGEKRNLLSLRGDKAIWRKSIFIWSKIALLALGEYQTIIVKGRKRTKRERKRKGEGKKEREIEEGRKEGNVVVCTLVGKEFPDVRQNERRIEFIRVGDAQLKGELIPYVS